MLRLLRQIAIVLVVSLATLFLLGQVASDLVKDFRQDGKMLRVPAELRATAMVYSEEKQFGAGFLPGDNEVGVAVYAFPADVGEAIKRRDLEFFADQGWAPTPVEISQERLSPEPGDLLFRYLDRYGYGLHLTIDPAVSAEINDALEQSGGFYRFGGGGALTIVSPTALKAYFIYAG